MRHHRPPDSGTARARLHEEVFQIKPRTAAKAAEMREKDRVADGVAVQQSHQHFNAGSFAERVLGEQPFVDAHAL